jgi:hypothetical protein
MQETTKPVVELSDISGPVLEAILKYLYTDEFESDSSVDLMTLFTTADKYGIDRLKRICEQSILSSMTVDNSCAIFRASDLVSAETMRSKTLEFIVRNYEAVVKTTSFEELARSNVELTLEIIRRQRN